MHVRGTESRDVLNPETRSQLNPVSPARDIRIKSTNTAPLSRFGMGIILSCATEIVSLDSFVDEALKQNP